MLPYTPPRVSLAQLPTPFRPLDRISRAIGGPRIWIKQDDRTGSADTGNKLRKLEFVVAQALSEGCDTLITCGGVQSNHCRTTALVAARMGLKAHLILRGDPSASIDGNLLLDHLAGAEVSIYDDKAFVGGIESIFEHWRMHYEGLGRKAYIIPMGASDEVGLWGYLNAAQELLADFENSSVKPDAIVVATGSGGTQAGLTLGFHLCHSNVPVFGVAVCDSEAYFLEKVRLDVRRWGKRWGAQFNASLISELPDSLNVHTLDGYIGPGYARGYKALYETIQWLAREEGVVLDPVYTGKAFYGLINEIKQGVFHSMKNIVFVHTGGVFGLFPHKDELLGM
ncbi:D-cysteine desulfhydrase family protein [Teredinibacter purpureus]|uniref:D-cysteine desulfhydrase family protein n=1 Tax=Teredinibacter purpureus TaxID=2731756 RepID=UPI0005F7A1C5|nr:D-cysteine desulfhydrase family protein [Teredinibacter purpureus]